MARRIDDKPKIVSRKRLARLRDKVHAPVRRDPPEMSSYPRELDVELFRIFSPRRVKPIRREKLVMLGGRATWPARDEWVCEEPGFWDVEIVSKDPLVLRRHDGYFGEFKEDGTFTPKPELTEIPHYTSNTDDATFLKLWVLESGRRLLIEEIESEPLSRWRASLLHSSIEVASGETYDTAASIVVAILSDLIDNESASWWIEVN